jgi:hypothetical protein
LILEILTRGSEFSSTGSYRSGLSGYNTDEVSDLNTVPLYRLDKNKPSIYLDYLKHITYSNTLRN